MQSREDPSDVRGCTGLVVTVSLVRIASAEIADRRRLFELFTALKTNSNKNQQQVAETEHTCRGESTRTRESARKREKRIKMNHPPPKNECTKSCLATKCFLHW